MKQNITPKQLNELSEKGRNRLRKWYLKTYLIDMTDMRQLALATKEELTAHYNRRIEDVLCLSIGQMIEFLEEHKTLSNIEYKTGQLCDTLWQATQEVLEE